MRSRIACLALLVPVVACSFRGEPVERDPTIPEPLHVRIWPDAFSYGVYVNRPAHVAIFEVVPGRGTGLAYPSHARQMQQVESGFTPLWRGLSMHRWAYLDDPPGAMRSMQPSYLLIVASEQPLYIDNYFGAMALRRSMPLHSFIAFQPFRAMEDLANMVLPEQPWYDYAVDVYYFWPAPNQHLSPRFATRTVVCPDGSAFRVRLDAYGAFNPCTVGRLVTVSQIAPTGNGTEHEREIREPPVIEPVTVARGVAAQARDGERPAPAVAEVAFRETSAPGLRIPGRILSPEPEPVDRFGRLDRHWSNRDMGIRGLRDSGIRRGDIGRTSPQREVTRSGPRAADRGVRAADRPASTGREVQPSRPSSGSDDKRPPDR